MTYTLYTVDEWGNRRTDFDRDKAFDDLLKAFQRIPDIIGHLTPELHKALDDLHSICHFHIDEHDKLLKSTEAFRRDMTKHHRTVEGLKSENSRMRAEIELRKRWESEGEADLRKAKEQIKRLRAELKRSPRPSLARTARPRKPMTWNERWKAMQARAGAAAQS